MSPPVHSRAQILGRVASVQIYGVERNGTGGVETFLTRRRVPAPPGDCNSSRIYSP